MKQIWSAAHTDVGMKKNINQDALLLKIANSSCGKVAFAVICDGMGGLQHGEVASEMLRQSYEKWFRQELPFLLQAGLTQSAFQESLEKVTCRADASMKQYAEKQHMQMGTTATLLLLLEERYYIFHIGDTRIYQVTASNIEQLTTDHTYVQQQIQRGILSQRQALTAAAQNVLLQCVGAGTVLQPEVSEGRICGPATFLLCSDGFRHKLEQRELFEQLNPFAVVSEEQLQLRLEQMTEWNKARGERDNISSIALKVF